MSLKCGSFADVAAELRRGGIRGLGLHTWQSVISASIARAEQNPFQVGISNFNTPTSGRDCTLKKRGCINRHILDSLNIKFVNLLMEYSNLNCVV